MTHTEFKQQLERFFPQCTIEVKEYSVRGEVFDYGTTNYITVYRNKHVFLESKSLSSPETSRESLIDKLKYRRGGR